MANKAVLDVEINDDEFTAFQARFRAFQDEVSKGADIWKKAPGMSAQGAGFQAVFNGAKSQTSQIANQNLRIQVGAWNSSTKSAKQFGQSIYQATMSLSRWSGLTSLFGSILAGGGLYGISRMAAGGMALRGQAAGYGVTPAELRASQTAFGRLGDMEGVLSGFSNAMHDIQRRRPLVSLFGADYDKRTKGKDAAQVFVSALPDIKRLLDRLDPRTLNQATHAYGLDELGITPDMARRIRNMKPQEIEEMRKSYGELKKAFKIDDAVLRTWSDLTAKIHRAGEQIEVAFLHDFSPLVPVLKDTLEWSVIAFKFMMKFGVSAVEGLIQARDLIMDAFDLNEAKGWLNDILPEDPSMFVGGAGGGGKIGGGGAKSFDGVIKDARKDAAKLDDKDTGGRAIDQLRKGDKNAAPTSKDALSYANPEQPAPDDIGTPSGGGAAASLETMKGQLDHSSAGREAIKKYLATGGHGMDPATVDWCAAAVGSALSHGGYKSPGSEIARDYLRYGSPGGMTPRKDDVVVTPRGGLYGRGGHVALATGRIDEKNKTFEVIEGDTRSPRYRRGFNEHMVGSDWESLSDVQRGRLVLRHPVVDELRQEAKRESPKRDNTKNDSRPSVKVTVNDYSGGSASVQKIIQRGAVQ